MFLKFLDGLERGRFLALTHLQSSDSVWGNGTEASPGICWRDLSPHEPWGSAGAHFQGRFGSGAVPGDPRRGCLKTGCQVPAYCLMSNHFHLVVETPGPKL